MTAATKDRDTQQTGHLNRSFPMKGNVKAFAGTIAHMDASGNVGPGITATTGRVVGFFDATFDNLGGAAAAKTADVVRGVRGPFANSSAGDLIGAADVDADCYLVDDQTLAKTNGSATRIVAGKVHAVDAAGVWLRVL